MKELEEQFPVLAEQVSFEPEEVDTVKFSRGRKAIK